MAITLEARIKVTGGTTGAAEIKKVGDAAKTAGAPIKTLQTDIDKLGKSTQGIGSKISQFGQKFAGTITSVGTLGATVVNLSRQYQDLGDTQIAVEKAQRRVSTADEAVKKAKTALAVAIQKYGKGSKQAKQATLDLAQAQSQLSINTQLLTERQEDHARAQEDFWLGLGPTVAAAGSTVMSVIKELSGTKGFGGLASAAANAAAAIGIPGKGGGAGGGGLLASLTAFARTGTGAAVSGATAGAAGGLFITAAGAQQQAALDRLTGVNQPGGPQRVSPFEMLLGDPKKRKEQIAAYEADIKVVEEASKRGVEISGFDYLQDALTNFLGGKSTIVEDKLKSVGLTAEVIQPAVKGLATGVNELGGEFTGLPPPVEAAKTSLESLNTSIGGMAANVKLLDANFQPLPATAQQLSDVLGQANANLIASASGVNTLAAATAAGTAQGANYAEKTRLMIAEENARQAALFKSAQSLLIKTANEDDSIAILEAEIDRQAAAVAKDWDRVASLTALIDKLRQANKAQGAFNPKAAAAMGRTVSSALQKGQKVRTFVNGREVFGTPPKLGAPGVGISVETVPKNYFKNLRKKKKKHGQHGLHEILTQDTVIMGHAGERLDVDRPGKGGQSGGFGGIVNIGPIYLDGEVVGKRMSFKLGKNQGTYK